MTIQEFNVISMDKYPYYHPLPDSKIKYHHLFIYLDIFVNSIKYQHDLENNVHQSSYRIHCLNDILRETYKKMHSPV